MFSVIIPVYNKGEYIERAINSIDLQSCDLVSEIIVVNDGSNDNSREIVKKLQILDSRIVLIDQFNQGVSSARNKGVDNSNNPYVLFLDADDEWRPNFVYTINSLIKRFPHCSVFSTAYSIEFPDKKFKNVTSEEVCDSNEGKEIKSYFKFSALGASPVWTSAVCVSKEAFDKVGGFPVGITHGEDKILWGKLALKFKFAWSPYVGAIYHMGTLNQSSGTWNPKKGREYLDFLTAIYQEDSFVNHDVFSAIVGQHRVIYNNSISRGYLRSAFKELYWLVRHDSLKSIPEHIARLVIPNYLIMKIKSLMLSSNIP
ncbi:hypothetical protein HVA01_32360 [Halovibrio variabilis]|uniref:Glycosyltransferase 2-like domain-containing protein n=1 Tax=Halovibrio variabilis TaxID=31910 RepID=A0A511USM0_9GAMM|nr:glycosyltransferase family 2 protein [Halovibrio variabilis]GEN29590.1 hypothetical protein HVA01_32360 [Halovibrio variabilis]